MSFRTVVAGPAYLDRVLHVDRPLLPDDSGHPVDGSAGGRLDSGDGLIIRDTGGGTLEIRPLPAGWPGPVGMIDLDRALAAKLGPWRRTVVGVECHDDLGGMGAGFSSALSGTLICGLGPEHEPITRHVERLLGGNRIEYRPVRVPGVAADWTLLLTSGPFGDKLPIGFRGCHDAITTIGELPPSDVRVVASWPNRLVEPALRAAGAGFRVFAPAVRNMRDRAHPLAGFADAVDLLCCNRAEWEALGDDGRVADALPMRCTTDGPNGASLDFRDAGGRRYSVSVPVFPRARPPRDTNRAGEAFAASLVRHLAVNGRLHTPLDEETAHIALRRASAAAALQLDLERFGFATEAEIDAALLAGIVE